jgi:hypothetical protein
MEVHRPDGVIDPEDTGKTVAEGHDRRIEDAVRAGQVTPPDDRVAA